jgi:hypothetical protein
MKCPLLRSLACFALGSSLAVAVPAGAEHAAASRLSAIPTFVYVGAGCTGRSQIAGFETMIGRKADGVVDFLANDTWQHMLDAAAWSMRCWPSTYQYVVSVPMLLHDGTSLANGARGDYDSNFARLASLLIKNGRGDAYVRLGWEFNGNWFPWAASKDPAAFRADFRRIVSVMRSQKGAKFKFIWNPVNNVEGVKPIEGYPGDDVVDVIGLDLYDGSWRPQDKSFESRWAYYTEQLYGLNWLRAFSAAHRKPVAFPEWGTGSRPDGHGYANDAKFIANVADWMKGGGVAFHSYWDYNAPDYSSKLSGHRHPDAEAAFVKAFGRR